MKRDYREVLTQLREANKTIAEIMAFTGLTRGQTVYYLKKYNLTKAHKGLSYVARNRTKGGTLITRIPKELHKKLADMCEANNESINSCVTRLIQEAVDS